MRRIISTALLALAVTFTTQAQEKVRFKVNPEKGKSLNYEMILKTDVEGAQDVMMDMKMGLTLTPSTISDTAITLDIKYTKVKMDINAGIMMLSYDSSEEPDNEMSKALSAEIKPLLDNKLTLIMGKNGKIKEANFPNVSEQAFDKSSLQSFSVGYPEKDIRIGDTWESNSNIAQLGIGGTVVNTLSEKTAEGYKIIFNGTYLDQNGNPIGTTDGYYIVNPKTFLTKSAITNSKIEVQGQKIATSLELKLIN